MGKAKLVRQEKCSQIVSLAPTRLIKQGKHLLNGQNQEMKLFSRTKIAPNLEGLGGIEGIYSIGVTCASS